MAHTENGEHPVQPMKYELNTQYDIEKQEVIGHGAVFFIRKGHRDNIVILDELSQALIGRARQQGVVDDAVEDAGGRRHPRGTRIRVIVVDAICTGAAPGTIHHLATDSLATQRSASAHDVNLPTALAFGRHAGAELPADHDVHLVGIEAQDVVNFNDHCTPAVADAIPHAVEEVVRLLETMLGEPRR